MDLTEKKNLLIRRLVEFYNSVTARAVRSPTLGLLLKPEKKMIQEIDALGREIDNDLAKEQ